MIVVLGLLAAWYGGMTFAAWAVRYRGSWESPVFSCRYAWWRAPVDIVVDLIARKFPF